MLSGHPGCQCVGFGSNAVAYPTPELAVPTPRTGELLSPNARILEPGRVARLGKRDPDLPERLRHRPRGLGAHRQQPHDTWRQINAPSAVTGNRPSPRQDNEHLLDLHISGHADRVLPDSDFHVTLGGKRLYRCGDVATGVPVWTGQGVMEDWLPCVEGSDHGPRLDASFDFSFH